MAIVASMSSPYPLPSRRPGWQRTVRQATVGALLLCLGMAPDLLSAEKNSSQLAALPKAGPTVARRAGRRPLGRHKHIITDQDILDQAQAAYIRGERQHAIDLATSIADKGGELATPAWRFIGLAACSVRANRLASRAYTNLATVEDQQALVRACQSNGLILLNNQFVER